MRDSGLNMLYITGCTQVVVEKISQVVETLLKWWTEDHVPMFMSFLKALRNSGLKMVYITGLTKLFMYPSQVVMMKAASEGWHVAPSLVQIASITLHVKNGTQQNKNTPAHRVKRGR